MIDWFSFFMNACWIFGCSMALATLSYACWEATQKGRSFRDIFLQPNIQIFINIGGVLFSIGLAGSTQILWQRILWIILSIGFLFQITIEAIARKNRNS